MNEPPAEGVDVAGAGGVRLSVRVHEGPLAAAPGLLLHHGLASSQRIWDLMLPRLTRHFRVVTYDARGHGRSMKPSSGYGFDPIVADARAVIRATGLRRPIVVGHSWGASVALELASRHPQAVGGAVLVDGGINTLRGEMDDWTTVKQRLAPPHLAGMPVEEFRRMIRTFVGDTVEVTPQVEEIVLSVMSVDRHGRIKPRLSRANHFRILRAIWLHDADASLARLSVPTLAILARGDDPAWDERKRRAADRAARSGAPLRISWMRGIHDLPLQHPGALSGRIERFSDTLVR
jgi:pimeloyl-ACP methyl ester carboxylesterase